jgi:hypothetical protein
MSFGAGQTLSEKVPGTSFSPSAFWQELLAPSIFTCHQQPTVLAVAETAAEDGQLIQLM